MAEFKVGDVVCLKSGGPAMTVDSVDEDGVICVWFLRTDASGIYTKPERDTFSPECLVPVKES